MDSYNYFVNCEGGHQYFSLKQNETLQVGQSKPKALTVSYSFIWTMNFESLCLFGNRSISDVKLEHHFWRGNSTKFSIHNKFLCRLKHSLSVEPPLIKLST